MLFLQALRQPWFQNKPLPASLDDMLKPSVIKKK